MRRPLLFLICLLLSGLASAEQPPVTSRFLLPLSFRMLTDSIGTEWSTELWMFLDSDSPFYVGPFDYGCPDDGVCGPPPPPPVVRRSVRRYPFVTHPGEAPGAILYTDATHSDLLNLTVVMTAISGGSEMRTTLPVVPEASFKTGTLHLLHIGFDSLSRYTVRVYVLDGPTDVRVRLVDESRETELGSRDFTLHNSGRNASSQDFGLALRPWAVEIDLLREFPLAASSSNFRIEVTPLRPDTPIWAMASRTNNGNDSVQIITSAP